MNLYITGLSFVIAQLQKYKAKNQGIIIMNKNGNFCKVTWVCKIIAETKVDTRAVQ